MILKMRVIVMLVGCIPGDLKSLESSSTLLAHFLKAVTMKFKTDISKYTLSKMETGTTSIELMELDRYVATLLYNLEVSLQSIFGTDQKKIVKAKLLKLLNGTGITPLGCAESYELNPVLKETVNQYISDATKTIFHSYLKIRDINLSKEERKDRISVLIEDSKRVDTTPVPYPSLLEEIRSEHESIVDVSLKISNGKAILRFSQDLLKLVPKNLILDSAADNVPCSDSELKSQIERMDESQLISILKHLLQIYNGKTYNPLRVESVIKSASVGAGMITDIKQGLRMNFEEVELNQENRLLVEESMDIDKDIDKVEEPTYELNRKTKYLSKVPLKLELPLKEIQTGPEVQAGTEKKAKSKEQDLIGTSSILVLPELKTPMDIDEIVEADVLLAGMSMAPPVKVLPEFKESMDADDIQEENVIDDVEEEDAILEEMSIENDVILETADSILKSQKSVIPAKYNGHLREAANLVKNKMNTNSKTKRKSTSQFVPKSKTTNSSYIYKIENKCESFQRCNDAFDNLETDCLGVVFKKNLKHFILLDFDQKKVYFQILNKYGWRLLFTDLSEMKLRTHSARNGEKAKSWDSENDPILAAKVEDMLYMFDPKLRKAFDGTLFNFKEVDCTSKLISTLIQTASAITIIYGAGAVVDYSNACFRDNNGEGHADKAGNDELQYILNQPNIWNAEHMRTKFKFVLKASVLFKRRLLEQRLSGEQLIAKQFRDILKSFAILNEFTTNVDMALVAYCMHGALYDLNLNLLPWKCWKCFATKPVFHSKEANDGFCERVDESQLRIIDSIPIRSVDCSIQGCSGYYLPPVHLYGKSGIQQIDNDSEARTNQLLETRQQLVIFIGNSFTVESFRNSVFKTLSSQNKVLIINPNDLNFQMMKIIKHQEHNVVIHCKETLVSVVKMIKTTFVYHRVKQASVSISRSKIERI